MLPTSFVDDSEVSSIYGKYVKTRRRAKETKARDKGFIAEEYKV